MQYKFGRRSRQVLSECHDDLVILAHDVIKIMDISAIDGQRSEELQNQYFRQGKSQLRWPDSKHNRKPSEAIDIVPFPYLASHQDEAVREAYRGSQIALGNLMKHFAEMRQIDLIWGGDWHWQDLAHFELR